ncbi:hypothetical protein MMC31_001070 [Peltigera leucophlebia]|nr:hypothetical protein [Peltigera leucophlebia]
MDVSPPHTPFKQAQIQLPTPVSRKRRAPASPSSSRSGTESPSPLPRSDWQAVNIPASCGRKANDNCKTVKGMEQAEKPARDEINDSPAPSNPRKRAKAKAIVFSDVLPHEIPEKPVYVTLYYSTASTNTL